MRRAVRPQRRQCDVRIACRERRRRDRRGRRRHALRPDEAAEAERIRRAARVAFGRIVVVSFDRAGRVHLFEQVAPVVEPRRDDLFARRAGRCAQVPRFRRAQRQLALRRLLAERAARFLVVFGALQGDVSALVGFLGHEQVKAVEGAADHAHGLGRIAFARHVRFVGAIAIVVEHLVQVVLAVLPYEARRAAPHEIVRRIAVEAAQRRLVRARHPHVLDRVRQVTQRRTGRQFMPLRLVADGLDTARRRFDLADQRQVAHGLVLQAPRRAIVDRQADFRDAVVAQHERKRRGVRRIG